MVNKILSIIVVVLLIAVGVIGFLYFTEKSLREDAENKFAEEKKLALRALTDSLNAEFTVKTVEFEGKITDLSNREQEIKYIPYEKLRYVDRNVDAALDTIAKYRFNSRTGE